MKLKVVYGENEFVVPFSLNTKFIKLNLLYKRDDLMIKRDKKNLPDWIYTVEDNDALASTK